MESTDVRFVIFTFQLREVVSMISFGVVNTIITFSNYVRIYINKF